MTGHVADMSQVGVGPIGDFTSEHSQLEVADALYGQIIHRSALLVAVHSCHSPSLFAVLRTPLLGADPSLLG
jgi:hypothetical protein